MPTPIPPAIALTLEETLRREPQDIIKLAKDKGFRRDLSDQGSASDSFYVDGSTPVEGDFNVYAAGGLSPFSTSAKCTELSCRIAHAQAFARSTCLYAQTVIAPDGFSKAVHRLDAYDLVTEIAVLQTLAPLIEAGVIRFAPSASGYCNSCLAAIAGTFTAVEDELWARLSGTFTFQLEDLGGRRRELIVSSDFDQADGTPITHQLKTTREDRRELPLDRWVDGALAARCVARHEEELRANLRAYVSELLFDVGIACPAGAVVGTNYRLGAAVLRVLDRREIEAPSLDEWEEMRSAPLPWIQGLSAEQVVRLREDAKPAMPAFRKRLHQALLSGGEKADDEGKARALAIELRHEALELEEKLRSLNIRGARRSKNLFTGLGLAVGLYGLGSQSPTGVLSGLTGFSAGMVAAHREAKELRHAVADLQRQPAYVLLTARRIHRGH